MKLKKAQTVKREWDDGGLEKVDLKHHEFEKPVQEEKVTISLHIRVCSKRDWTMSLCSWSFKTFQTTIKNLIHFHFQYFCSQSLTTIY